jgi:hypothetical protein
LIGSPDEIHREVERSTREFNLIFQFVWDSHLGVGCHPTLFLEVSIPFCLSGLAAAGITAAPGEILNLLPVTIGLLVDGGTQRSGGVVYYDFIPLMDEDVPDDHPRCGGPDPQVKIPSTVLQEQLAAV